TRFYSHGRQTAKSILIIHGLHESPAFMHGFSQYFFDKGYNVLSLRLPLHMMKNPRDLNDVKASMWIKAAEQAFHQAQALGIQTEVLGYSTGGTLGVYLALNYPEQVKNLYLIAPALALDDRVFLTSTLAGCTKKDLSTFCSAANADKIGCKILLATDDQLKVMVKDNIYSSPAAGFQVQNLINKIEQQFNPNPSQSVDGKRDYYGSLTATYLQMKVPIVMINSELDNVVKASFNDRLMRNYKYPNKKLLFKKIAGVNHIMINKARVDAFKNSPQIYNPYFNDMTNLIEELNR
ncbi:MAG: alpha/beta hydrolase, partial [Bdellovibrionaceae bacterium]|nr:alpha/beta hydrolase [Bdellovibrio sp.]